jgi:hypothetical protein
MRVADAMLRNTQRKQVFAELQDRKWKVRDRGELQATGLPSAFG